MSAEVTDPALLAELNADAPEAPLGKEVKDPAVLAQLNAVPTPGGSGASGTWEAPQDKLPFGDKVALDRADNFEEKELYMQNRYGKKAVTREWGDDGNPVLTVRTDDGKVFRIGGKGDNSFVAQIAADSPKLVGMGAGATTGAIYGAELGAAGGPPGMAIGGGLGAVIGAGVGAMAGKGAVEADKALEGNYKKTPRQLGASLLEANREGEEGEMGGRVITRGISEVGSMHLPKFITGATDETEAATAKAWKAGARPSAVSYAPDMKKLSRIEVLSEKTIGKSEYQDKRNMAYVRSTVREALKGNGIPESHVDAFMNEMEAPEQAFSHNDLGDSLKDSVKAHVESINAAVDKTAKLADSHIDVQLANVRKVMDSSDHADLTGHVGAMVESAYKDFKGAASTLYDKALGLTGKEPVVDVTAFSEPAERLVAEIKESMALQVPGIVKKMSQVAGRQLDERDAILLNEFGIEVPQTGKMTLRGAQRLRTVLRDKAWGGEKLTKNTTNHDYGVMADAVGGAIEDTYKDPTVRPAVEALRKADEFYQSGINKFKDAEVNKLIKRYRDEYPPDAKGIVDIITKPGYSSRTLDLKRMIGADVWKEVQSIHMQDFLKPYVAKDPLGKEVVDDLGLLKALRDPRQMATFKAVHGEDAVKPMQELAEMAAARRGAIPAAQLAQQGPKAALAAMQMHEARLAEFMDKNALAILADEKKTGEEAYQFVARPGVQSERNLMAAAKLFGANSPQMKGLQQAALEETARNANIAAIKSGGSQGIDKALSAYTPNQLKLLFPNGMDKDLREIGKVIKFMYPQESGIAKDQAAAGFTAGFILQMPFFARLPIQATQAVMRFIVLHPAFAKFITVGHENFDTWAPRTAAMLQKIAAGSIAEGQVPDNNQTSQPKPNAPAPTMVQ